MKFFGRSQPSTVEAAWDELPADRAARKRRASHRDKGAAKAARKGQEWEDAARLADIRRNRH
ncbi:hypothetical protein ABZ820_12720 [Streptomyces diacarni]|uniref:hypothetical protein n=1 Tax=Streptomyces diacarni TaxID=2800381 RepID=UPI0033D3CF9F